KKLFLPSPAARGGYAARDAVTAYMFFSCISLKSGNAREIQEGTSWFPFFRHFFVERQRKGNKCFPRARATGTV
ncbi:MAG: hypothetical protein IJW09_01945, partial [Clostridia bacterium]|nr:hypothetical protein [Clostridia bacterium]